ncbi:hypothetical protein ACFL56_01280 [Candidatus Margulisiibacteriota bacterium]
MTLTTLLQKPNKFLHPSIARLVKLLPLWRKLPPKFQEHIIPVMIRGRTLYCEADHSVWIHEFKQIEKLLTKKWKEKTGIDIAHFRFKITSFEEEKKDTKKSTYIFCPRCKKYRIPENTDSCVICRIFEKTKKRQIVYKILFETPWIAYGDFEYKEQITETEFKKLKKQYYEKNFKDTEILLNEYKYRNMKSNKSKICKKMYHLLALKTSLTPSKINEKILLENSEKTLSRWYKREVLN